MSLRWAHMPFCWFCHEAAQLMYMLSKEPIVANSNIGRLKTTTHWVIFSLVRFIATFSYSKNPNFLHFPTPNFCFEVLTKKLIEKSRECNNHKPQPTPDTKRKRKMTKLTYTKQTNKCTRSTQVTSHFVPRSFRTKVISYHFGHFVPTFIFNLVISYPFSHFIPISYPVWSFHYYFYYFLENRFGHFVPIFYCFVPKSFRTQVISYPKSSRTHFSHFVPRSFRTHFQTRLN